MITTPIFTRLLSTEEYGQYSVFASWLGIAGIIVGLSLTAGVHSQGLIKFSDERTAFTSSLQGLSATLVLGWTIVFLLFRPFWEKTLELPAIQILAMLIMVWTSSVSEFWANEQRVMYRYKTLVFITLLVSVASPTLGILFVLHAKDKVTARILGMVITGLLGYAWIFIAQVRRGKVFYSGRFWKYALLFNLPLVPHYLSQVVLNNSDRIMIERMVGASEAGIYSLAYSVGLIMTLFNSALMQTLSPWMYQKIKDKQEKDIAPIAYMTLGIIAIMNLLLILLAPEAVAIFAPKTYYEAIWVIPPIAMSVYFIYCYDLYAKFAFYYEKTGYIMLASICASALNLVLNYIFIRRFGYIAAGYTTLVCYMTYTLGHHVFMKRVCEQYCDGRYPYNEKIILSITSVFLTCGFALLMTYHYPAVRYGIVFVVVVAAIIMQKRIIKAVKQIAALRK